jgi:hypothetical protein
LDVLMQADDKYFCGELERRDTEVEKINKPWWWRCGADLAMSKG